jgi:translation initiation factor IF-3
MPKLEGRQMIMMIAPGKKKAGAAPKAAPAAAAKPTVSTEAVAA